jgi:hypothetical protein
VPLEEHIAIVYVDLLQDAIQDDALFRATDRGEVHRYLVIDRDEGGVPEGNGELVQVSPVAAARPDPGHLPVRVVQDHVLADAVPLYDPALPPDEHRSAPIVLYLEVRRVLVLAEPHGLTTLVEDHGAVLPSALL